MEEQPQNLETGNTVKESNTFNKSNTTTKQYPNQQFRSQKPNYARKGNFYFRRKVCRICTKEFTGEVDYKNVYLLKRFITEKGKILPRRISGLCAKHHRIISKVIKQARSIALLSFTERN